MGKGRHEDVGRLWLASYPRSGNTFLRVILHDVYGVTSGELKLADTGEPVPPDFDKHPVVKTHLRPAELVPSDPSIPTVYIVRDGRDALVSMAHHRCDIVAPGSDYMANLEAAIRAEEGSHFGGWSTHVREWMERASVVIRFENLIGNPIGCAELLRPFLRMPDPDMARVPTFESLRSGQSPWVQKELARRERPGWEKSFFRRGVIGSYKEEMPAVLADIFWELHGNEMAKLSYVRNGDRPRGPILTRLLLKGKSAVKRIVKAGLDMVSGPKAG